jgi:hypothetical protein
MPSSPPPLPRPLPLLGKANLRLPTPRPTECAYSGLALSHPGLYPRSSIPDSASQSLVDIVLPPIDRTRQAMFPQSKTSDRHLSACSVGGFLDARSTSSLSLSTPNNPATIGNEPFSASSAETSTAHVDLRKEYSLRGPGSCQSWPNLEYTNILEDEEE